MLPDVGKRLDRVSLAPHDLRRVDGAGVLSAGTIRVYRVGYVRTVPARYPVLYTGLWPDRLMPNEPVAVAGTDLGLFWVEIKVPRDAAPGDYRGEMSLELDGQNAQRDRQIERRGLFWEFCGGQVPIRQAVIR